MRCNWYIKHKCVWQEDLVFLSFSVWQQQQVSGFPFEAWGLRLSNNNLDGLGWWDWWMGTIQQVFITVGWWDQRCTLQSVTGFTLNSYFKHAEIPYFGLQSVTCGTHTWCDNSTSNWRCNGGSFFVCRDKRLARQKLQQDAARKIQRFIRRCQNR